MNNHRRQESSATLLRVDRVASRVPPRQPAPRLGGYPRTDKHGWRRWVPSIRQLAVCGVLGAVLFACLMGIAYVLIRIPGENALSKAQATVFAYEDTTTIASTGVNRQKVSLDQVPQAVQNAVLAAEDRDFYENPGVSLKSITRAVVKNVTGGRIAQGGSTITQQVAKNSFLSQERSLWRKFREFFIAIKLDQKLTKDQILQRYLNVIWFGRGAYGIQAASQAYFGKDVKDLTVSEAAALAAIIPNPSAYTSDQDRWENRWQYVLDGMVEQGWLTLDQKTKLKFPTVKKYTRGNQLAGPKGYLVDLVQKELDELGFTERALETEGLKVVTTFDPGMQAAAEKAVQEQLYESTSIPQDVQVGLAAVEPETGQIKALYGGQDFVKRQLNAATQASMQGGSTFKPFTLAAALENDIALESRFNGDNRQEFAGGYIVQNDYKKDYGFIDLPTATAKSINTAYVNLAIEVGPGKVKDAAIRAGIPADTGGLEAEAGITLGTASPHVLDLANAYATFAAEGVRAKPHAVLQVIDPDGSVRYDATEELEGDTERVFERDVVSNVSYALQGVITNGTGARAARAVGLTRPAAGKSGTSQDEKSALFAGYTPQLSAAVGMFRDANGTPMSLNGVGGLARVTGSSYPARIWAAFMKAALNGQQRESFPPRTPMGQILNPPPPPEITPPETDLGNPALENLQELLGSGRLSQEERDRLLGLSHDAQQRRNNILDGLFGGNRNPRDRDQIRQPPPNPGTNGKGPPDEATSPGESPADPEDQELSEGNPTTTQ